MGNNHFFFDKHERQSPDLSGSFGQLPCTYATSFGRSWLGFSYFSKLTIVASRMAFELADRSVSFLRSKLLFTLLT
jgi:hypothetical protein